MLLIVPCTQRHACGTGHNPRLIAVLYNRGKTVYYFSNDDIQDIELILKNILDVFYKYIHEKVINCYNKILLYTLRLCLFIIFTVNIIKVKNVKDSQFCKLT